MENAKLCVVFVVDRAYYPKFVDTCSQLRTAGNYKGDICLIIGDDLNNPEFLQSNFINNTILLSSFTPTYVFHRSLLKIKKH